jgi:hypothetical protein
MYTVGAWRITPDRAVHISAGNPRMAVSSENITADVDDTAMTADEARQLAAVLLEAADKPDKDTGPRRRARRPNSYLGPPLPGGGPTATATQPRKLPRRMPMIADSSNTNADPADTRLAASFLPIP